MNRLLLVVLALLLAALGWQTWRLADASQTISTQADELQSKSQALAKSNSQLISLSILTETNNREQARLYAEAEQTSALLRQRQHRIEELKRENEDLRRWADTPLPADIIRLRERPALTEVDRANWLCRVKTGDLETNWINWLTLRAGKSRTWWKPSVGEQVVLFSLGGNLETAFALPAVYSNQFPPPSDSEDGNVTEYPDGGWFEYEPATGRWYVRGIKSMVIEAADNITLKTSEFVLEADRTRINSEVVINGGVTQGGGAMSSNGIVVDAHQHTGVLKGGDTTGGPV